MAGETYDFEFLISFDQKVPEWAWGKVGMYHGQITAAAIEKLAGPAAPPRTLRDSFEDIVGAAKNIAGEKVKRAGGALPEPIIVSVTDIP